jgi:hypothetical protein
MRYYQVVEGNGCAGPGSLPLAGGPAFAALARPACRAALARNVAVLAVAGCAGKSVGAGDLCPCSGGTGGPGSVRLAGARRPVPILALRAGLPRAGSSLRVLRGPPSLSLRSQRRLHWLALGDRCGDSLSLVLPFAMRHSEALFARPLRCAVAFCAISTDFRPAGHSPCIPPDHAGWGMLTAITRDYSSFRWICRERFSSQNSYPK